jgi:hypothetical protein
VASRQASRRTGSQIGKPRNIRALWRPEGRGWIPRWTPEATSEATLSWESRNLPKGYNRGGWLLSGWLPKIFRCRWRDFGAAPPRMRFKPGRTRTLWGASRCTRLSRACRGD